MIGYTIEFLKSDAITIYNGIQGEADVDGETPQIDLTQGSDGNWYWTLSGELMTDSDGNPIRANGEDGADGKDAPTPQIKLGSTIISGTLYGLDGEEQSEADEDAWYLSVDDGETWYRVTGEKGDKGDKGDTGATGATGETGAAGADGKDGVDGRR